MISIESVLQAHTALIKRYGGQDGVRDIALLESALARPFQEVFGTELYPTPAEKAAAILESLTINHPFVDGNKRIAWVMALTVLKQAGLTVKTDTDTNYEFVVNVACGNLKKDEVIAWFDAHIAKR